MMNHNSVGNSIAIGKGRSVRSILLTKMKSWKNSRSFVYILPIYLRSTNHFDNFFLFFQESTIGAAFLTQTVLLDDTTVKFEIWDTAGQERYHSLAPMYYRGAQAAIVVYDITNADTFTRAKTWVRELQKQARPDIVIALAGNKSDLGSRRTVEYEEANAYAEENGLLFMETSAKNANNVNEIFLAIARRLPRDAEAGSSGNSGRRLEEGGNNEGGNKLGQCCNRWCI